MSSHRYLEEALAVHQQTVSLFPNDLLARNGLARTLDKLGRCEEALTLLQDTILRFPDDVVARNFVASLLSDLGRLHEALDFQRDTILRFPDNALARNVLAKILQELGSQVECTKPKMEDKVVAVRREFLRTIESSPRSTEILSIKKPRIFIGSSVEGLTIAEHIQLGLDHQAECTLWSQGVFGLSGGTLDSLLRAAKDFEFAVLVLTPDDLVHKRDATKNSPRDNVMGALGREKTYIVYCRDEKIDFPTDLAGVTTATFAKRSDGNLHAAMGAVCTQIKTAIDAAKATEAKPLSSLEPGAVIGPGKNTAHAANTGHLSGPEGVEPLSSETHHDEFMSSRRTAALLSSIPNNRRQLVNLRWVVGNAVPAGSGYGDGQASHFEVIKAWFDCVDLLGNVASFTEVNDEHSVFLPLDQIKTIWRKAEKGETIWEISIVGSLHLGDNEWQLWPPT